MKLLVLGVSAGMVLIAQAPTALAADAQSLCSRAVIDYGDAWDHHDGQRFAALFTDDATLDLGTGPAKGRAAIAELFAKRNPGATTRHLMTNIAVTPQGATAAKGLSYLQLFAGPGGAADGKPIETPGFALVGEYQDVYRLTPTSCRFVDRKLVNVFRRAAPPRPPAAQP